jgi:sensor histidine kinase YesM
MKSWLRKPARIVAANAIVALVPAFLIEGSVGSRAFWATFAVACVYANLIGCTAHFVLPRVWNQTCSLRWPWDWASRIVILLAIAVAGSLVAGLIFMGVGLIRASDYWATFRVSGKISVVLTLLCGIAISIYERQRSRLESATLELRAKELDRERVLKLAAEARLAALEARIHPHFLFNTLNSISSLIPEDPLKAERLVEQMAALLRFSLDARQGGLAPLGREMRIVEDYLEIERARFGERLRYRLDIPAELETAQVPPLSVQTLVENSVKYAVAPNRAGGEILVAGSNSGGWLRIEVRDSGPGFEMDTVPAGHGIDNLRSRLAGLFGDDASLACERNGEWSVVRLSIPRDAPGAGREA